MEISVCKLTHELLDDWLPSQTIGDCYCIIIMLR